MAEQTEDQIGWGALRLSDDELESLLRGAALTITGDPALDEALDGLTERQRQVLIVRVADIAGGRAYEALDQFSGAVEETLIAAEADPSGGIFADMEERQEEVRWKYAGER